MPRTLIHKDRHTHATTDHSNREKTFIREVSNQTRKLTPSTEHKYLPKPWPYRDVRLAGDGCQALSQQKFLVLCTRVVDGEV